MHVGTSFIAYGETAKAIEPGESRPHSLICGDVPGGIQLGSYKGQRTYIGLRLRGAVPMNSGLMGQVGQESNLQPAVVEPAAVRSAAFSRVQNALQYALFGDALSSDVQERPAGL